jgi:hypothetical protein
LETTCLAPATLFPEAPVLTGGVAEERDFDVLPAADARAALFEAALLPRLAALSVLAATAGLLATLAGALALVFAAVFADFAADFVAAPLTAVALVFGVEAACAFVDVAAVFPVTAADVRLVAVLPEVLSVDWRERPFAARAAPVPFALSFFLADGIRRLLLSRPGVEAGRISQKPCFAGGAPTAASRGG